MENIIRDVRELDFGDRRAMEHIVGKPLEENQRLVIQIVSLDIGVTAPVVGKPTVQDDLPHWCNVYEGLTDAEVADIEKSIVRSYESRSLT